MVPAPPWITNPYTTTGLFTVGLPQYIIVKAIKKTTFFIIFPYKILLMSIKYFLPTQDLIIP
jgi:hypothetical protein